MCIVVWGSREDVCHANDLLPANCKSAFLPPAASSKAPTNNQQHFLTPIPYMHQYLCRLSTSSPAAHLSHCNSSQRHDTVSPIISTWKLTGSEQMRSHHRGEILKAILLPGPKLAPQRRDPKDYTGERFIARAQTCSIRSLPGLCISIWPLSLSSVFCTDIVMVWDAIM